MKIIILGAKGQLGKELSLGLLDNNLIYNFGRETINIIDYGKISTTIRKIKPDIIINCAAFTAVDKAEKNINEAFKINHEAVKYLANESKKNNILLIHFSTDYVFDGLLKRSYLETDNTNPLNIYGKSKLQGEKEIEKINGNYIIFRTSWLIGKYGINFVKKILNSLNNNDNPKVINDCFGSPTSTKLILKVVKYLINDFKNNNFWDPGIYHLSSKGYTNWFIMAKLILNIRKSHFDIVNNQKIIPISISDIKTLAKRPVNSRLNSTKIEKILNFKIPYWVDDFSEAVEEIINPF